MAEPAEIKAAQTHQRIATSAGAIEHSAGAIQTSAGAIETSTAAQTDSADRRTALAADRTLLAAERTYAAWLRTALTALASGIGAKALLLHHVPDWLATSAGVLLVAFAMFCLFAGVWRELDPGAPPPLPDIKRIPPLVLIAFNASLGIVCLAAIVGFFVL